MSASNSAIDAAIAAAQAAAAAAAAAPAPALSGTASGSLPTVAAPGRARTLADAVEAAPQSVDLYLQVDYSGMHIDKTPDVIETIDVRIALADLKFPYSLRYTSAGQTIYLKSIDGVREARSGQSWHECIARAQSIDPMCKGSYDSVELVMELISDVDLKKSKRVIEAGSKLGYTTPYTGYALCMDWLKAAFKEFGPAGIVPVRLTHIPKQKGSNNWGVIGFETLRS